MRRKATEIEEIAAAYLFATEDLTQAEIGKTLGISAPVVSRLLASARRNNYLIEEFRFGEERLQPGTMQAVRQRLSPNALADKLHALSMRTCQRPGPRVRVFPTPGQPAGEEEALAAFARQATPHIRDLVLRSRYCGVTWGRMLQNVIRAMRNLRMPARSPRLDVIPLAGEPLGMEPTPSSSSTLAHELGRIINGDKYHARSLTMVPALVPSDFTRAERLAVFKLVERLPDYGAIFGRVAAHQKLKTEAYRLDCILTSLFPRALGFTGGQALSDAEMELFVGDMGGVMFPRPDLSKADERLTQDIEARWTGLRQDHVEACAERARAFADDRKGPPGVILISVGEKRAHVVLEAIKRGLINHLVIDSQLEQALTRSPDLRSLPPAVNVGQRQRTVSRRALRPAKGLPVARPANGASW